MNDCLSCGLLLPAGVQHCPGCGTDQTVQLAKVDEARCSLHAETQATGTCSRCGRFMCVECSAVDAGVCRGCVELVHRDVLERFTSLTVRSGWVAVVQGFTAVAVSHRSGQLFYLLTGIAAFSVVFGLVTVARRELWIVGAIACALIGFISFFALLDTPLLVVCIALAILEWRFITRAGPLEREVWLLRKRHGRS